MYIFVKMKSKPTKYKFKPDAELLKFADEFSANFKKTKLGTYQSDNGNYTIEYKKELLMNDGVKRHSMACVKREDGVIHLCKTDFIKTHMSSAKHGVSKISSDFVYFLILHCRCMYELGKIDKEKRPYMDADIHCCNFYFKTGRSKKNLLIGYLLLFSNLHGGLDEAMIRYAKVKKLTEQLKKNKSINK